MNAPRSSRRRALRAALFAGALCLALAQPIIASVSASETAQDGLPAPPPAPVEIVRALRLLRDPAAPPVASLADELAGPAAQGLDALLDALARREVPGLDGAPVQRLSEPQLELVLALLARLPRADVLAALERLPAGVGGARRQLAVLDALGAVGGVSDMSAFFERAEQALLELPADALEPVLQRATASLLRRSANCHEWLLAKWRHLPQELLPAVLRAVGDVRDPRGLELLTEVVLFRSDVAPVAIAQVALVGPSSSEDVNERLRALLRSRLDPSALNLCRAAALALAELGDDAAIPELIELLDAEHAGVRANALWALRRTSALSFPAHPRLWRSWHESEVAWFGAGFERALSALAEPDPARAAAAIRELAVHRLHRARIAEGLTRALEHRSSTVRVLACRTLAELGRSEALPALRTARQDPDEDVSAAAVLALERLMAATSASGAGAESAVEAGRGGAVAATGARSRPESNTPPVASSGSSPE